MGFDGVASVFVSVVAVGVSTAGPLSQPLLRLRTRSVGAAELESVTSYNQQNTHTHATFGLREFCYR